MGVLFGELRETERSLACDCMLARAVQGRTVKFDVLQGLERRFHLGSGSYDTCTKVSNGGCASN